MSEDPDIGHIGKINVEGIKSGSNEPYAEEEQRRLFERQESKHRRDQSARWHIHKVSMIALWIVASVSIVVSIGFVIIWAWHILSPEKLQFLEPGQIDTIEAVLLSIVGSSFLTGYAKNWLSSHAE